MEEEWTCAVCHDIILDPIALQCGHDFCQHCLLRWADSQQQQQQASPGVPHTSEPRPVACPLCRAPLANSFEEVTRWGVCVRLRQAVEGLFPAQLKRRREQLQLQKREGCPRQAATQRQAQALQARHGRSRYLRARRTRPPLPSPPLTNLASPSTQPQHPQHSNHAQHPQQQSQHANHSPATPSQPHTPLSLWQQNTPGSSSAGAHTGNAAHSVMDANNGAAVITNAADGSAAAAAPEQVWSTALVPSFCVGWYEPGERRRGRRRCKR